MMMQESLFKNSTDSPYHLSVGAILFDENKRVACHYFDEILVTDEHRVYTDLYILMRETVEMDESLEKAVLRGIEEEFGATGEIERFIGTLLTQFPKHGVWIEKTTAYFLVKLKRLNVKNRALDDEENVSEIQWQQIDYLIAKMKEQGKKYDRMDFDESEILKRAKKYLLS